MHPLWSYIFVIKYNLGVQGTGIAGIITNSIVLFCNLAYSCYSNDLKDAIFWPDRRSLTI
jgi:Na+-driven multidrug efflux pump